MRRYLQANRSFTVHMYLIWNETLQFQYITICTMLALGMYLRKHIFVSSRQSVRWNTIDSLEIYNVSLEVCLTEFNKWEFELGRQ